MPKANLVAQVRQAGSGASIIDIQGDVTGFADTALSDAFAQASARGERTIILNFTGLDYMNSSGIGLLVTLLIRAQRQSQRLIAFGLTEHYRDIFELTRLNEAIMLLGSEAEALQAAAVR